MADADPAGPHDLFCPGPSGAIFVPDVALWGDQQPVSGPGGGRQTLCCWTPWRLRWAVATPLPPPTTQPLPQSVPGVRQQQQQQQPASQIYAAMRRRARVARQPPAGPPAARPVGRSAAAGGHFWGLPLDL